MKLFHLKVLPGFKLGGFLIRGISMLVPKQFPCSCVHYRLIMKEDAWRMKMTTAQVVETSATVNNNSPIQDLIQDYVHPDDQTQPTYILFVLWTLSFRLLKNVKNPNAVLCVIFGALLLYLTLHLVGKLPKLSICYLSCWLKWNPPTKYYWTIWHPSCKNLTIQLSNWTAEW